MTKLIFAKRYKILSISLKVETQYNTIICVCFPFFTEYRSFVNGPWNCLFVIRYKKQEAVLDTCLTWLRGCLSGTVLGRYWLTWLAVALSSLSDPESVVCGVCLSEWLERCEDYECQSGLYDPHTHRLWFRRRVTPSLPQSTVRHRSLMPFDSQSAVWTLWAPSSHHRSPPGQRPILFAGIRYLPQPLFLCSRCHWRPLLLVNTSCFPFYRCFAANIL